MYFFNFSFLWTFTHFLLPPFFKNNILMWTTFKVFIEFITMLLLFYILAFWPQGTCDPSSLTRELIELEFPTVEGKVPITGPPGKFLLFLLTQSRNCPVTYQSQLPILRSCPPILPEVTAPSCIPISTLLPFSNSFLSPYSRAQVTPIF